MSKCERSLLVDYQLVETFIKTVCTKEQLETFYKHTEKGKYVYYNVDEGKNEIRAIKVNDKICIMHNCYKESYINKMPAMDIGYFTIRTQNGENRLKEEICIQIPECLKEMEKYERFIIEKYVKEYDIKEKIVFENIEKNEKITNFDLILYKENIPKPYNKLLTREERDIRNLIRVKFNVNYRDKRKEINHASYIKRKNAKKEKDKEK